MKMRTLMLPAAIIAAFVLVSFKPANNVNEEPTKHDLKISEEVQKIIDNSCVGCHNLESRNEKGRAKLTFETLDTLALAKLVGKLGEISEEVDEDKMPPARFLEFKPEAKLSADQKAALIKWADTTAESLLGE